MYVEIEEKYEKEEQSQQEDVETLETHSLGIQYKPQNLPFKQQVLSGLTKNNLRKRSLYKDGKCSAHRKHASHSQFVVHMQDIFTSLVESTWKVTLVAFSTSFLVTWLLFSVLWWIIALEHGDLKDSPSYDPNREPCVTMMDDFISCFLFSLETQYSTGYGSRSPTTQCPEAIALLVVQSIFGVFIQSTMAGIVFVKLSRPKARSQHIIFSKRAVICLRDGHLSLLFRVGDFRKSHIVGATLRAWLLQHRISREGEVLPHYQHVLPLSVDSGGSDAFLIWPSTVLHRIDESSPLYELSALDVLNASFEIVVVLNGTVEATGQTTEARTSYTPSEILWGHRFKQLIKFYRKRRYDFAVDYSRFDETFAVDTPLCSAHELHQCNQVHLPGTPKSSADRANTSSRFSDVKA